MDKFPRGPEGEETAYSEEMLEMELAAILAMAKKSLEERLASGGDTWNDERIIKSFSESPAKAFRIFQNNFYLHLPSKHRDVALGAFKEFEMHEDVERLEKMYKDIDSVLEECGVTSETMGKIEAGSGNLLDPEVYRVLRKAYIGMRKKGYSHKDLT